MALVPDKFDIQIQVGSTNKGFMLAQQNGVKHWEATRLAMFSPRMSIDEAKYAQVPPEQEILWIQEHFHGGFGQKTVSDPNRYFYNTMVDTRDKDVAFLAPLWNAANSWDQTAPDYPCIQYCWFKSNLYVLFSKDTGSDPAATTVWKYNTSTSKWDRKLNLTVNGATDLKACAGYLLVALGSANKYYYSSDGSAYTQATASNTEMSYFAEVRGTVYGVKDSNSLYSTTDPTTAGTWSTAQTIGDTQYNFTSLLNYRDVLLIGKQDGLYSYDRDTIDREILPEFKLLPHADNFHNPCIFQNRAYLPVRFGLLEYDGFSVRNIAPSVYGNQVPNFSPQIFSVTATPDWLYLVAKKPIATTTTRNIIYAGRREIIDGVEDWWWHPLYVSALTATIYFGPLVATPAYLTGVNNALVWATVAYIPYYIKLPISFFSPVNDSTCEFYNGTRELYTSEWNGGFADINKAFTKIGILSSFLSGTAKTIAIYYSIDDGAWALAGTANTSPIQTISFPSTAIGKKLALRFDMQSDSSAYTPGLKGFVLHAVLRPLVYWRWVFTVRVADNIVDNQRAKLLDTAATLATHLASAYTTVWPSILTDRDGTTHNVILYPVRDVEVLDEKNRRTERHYTLEAIEAILT